VLQGGDEGALAGLQVDLPEALGGLVEQVRAPAGQLGEARVGVGLDPLPVARLGGQAARPGGGGRDRAAEAVAT